MPPDRDASVLTSAVPVIKDWLTPKNSAISVTFQGANKSAITVLVSNSGVRPGTVSQPMSMYIIEPTLGSGTTSIGQIQVMLRIVDQPNNTAFSIQPGKSMLLSLSFAALPADSMNVPQFNRAKCLFELRESDFQGERTPWDVAINCSELNEFLSPLIKGT
jgi:hypothetical protein